MDEQLKKRLVGAAVLASLMVIFLPMLLETQSPLERDFAHKVVPDSPYAGKDFDAKVLPLPSEAPAPKDAVPPPSAPASPNAIDNAFNAPIVKDLPVAPPPPASAPVDQGAQPAPSPAQAQPGKVEQEPVDAKEAARVDSPSPDGLSAWAIQVASFPDREKADTLVQELRGMKYSAFSVEAVVAGRTWHRVRIGPVTDKVRAEKILALVREDMAGKGLAPRIVRFP
ncbi:MAG: SPOR domain-containing protein [Gammaproteobacteria bacterium]|nr:SPOR domain-containing protein [Gammaproteobacteria bacterium]MBU1653979.1 SPOR domain-containing protein [Gammaproteobacteria bacterium]MBU1960469.1 SPOR domain-containing protein [Gammaproteobacteria bacterium]